MKKLIYVLVVALCAAFIVSCGGNKYAHKIHKGDKSRMDTLSYAIGANIGYNISTRMADLKFDWKVLSEAADKALTKNIAPRAEDEEHKKAIEVLDSFFNTTRNERLDAYVESLNIPDSLKYSQPIDFTSYDVFEGNDEERKKVSEAYGCDMGSNLRGSRLPLATIWFHKGVIDAATNKSEMTPERAMYIIQDYFSLTLPVINSQQSKEWLASIEKKRGVKKTESGLLYRIDRMGDESIKPTANDKVKVDYEGKLRDGFVFDSSYERGQSIEFPLSGVIPGWTEGLQYVGKGGQITLWIPSDLGYGVYGNGGGVIGPNEALEFKVELHDVTSTATPESVPSGEAAKSETKE